jgi:hypothetical protein
LTNFCIIFANFPLKWSNSSLLTYFLRKSWKCFKVLEQSHYVHLKLANYSVGWFNG